MTKTDRDHPTMRKWWKFCTDRCKQLGWRGGRCEHEPPGKHRYVPRPTGWTREQNRIERGVSNGKVRRIIRDDADNMPSGRMYHRPWWD